VRETQILLTGGTGFFGRALLRNWQSKQNAGHTVPEVTVLSRSPDAFQAQYPEFSGLSWLTLHLGDITEPDSFPQGQKYSHVLHAATDSTLGPQILPMQRYDQIVEGTRNILDFAISCNARRFLLISSGGVYGPQPAELEQIPEDYHAMPDPLDSGNVYSVAKSASEHLCALYNETYGLHTVIARCFAFVGKDLPLDAHFAIR
jgi:UDP-glucuronate decarboxylase